MKRNILYIAIACMTLLASCKKEINQVLPSAVEMEFGATVDDNGGKTYLDGTSVLWADGDQISVNGTAIDLVAGAGYRYGTFRGKVTPYSTDKFYVGYPASATTYSAGTMTVAIPAAQTYNSTQTLLGVMPMAAYVQGTGNKMTLHFHNAANLLKINLTGTAGNQSKVTRIEITSTAALTGKVPVSANGTDGVTFDYNSMTDLGYTITLDCGAGVQLTNTATPFYVIIPKIASSAALNVKIYCANGAYQENTLTSAFNSVNQIYSTAAKEVAAGALGGEFSVSATKKVRFSQGNLWCNTNSYTWAFEDNQWNRADGWNAGHSGYFYWTSNNYGAAQTYTSSGDESLDWGVAVASQLGEGWATLSFAEWNWLIKGRTNYASKIGPATVHSVEGVVILPDVFTEPYSGCLTPYSSGTTYGTNKYNDEQWNQMEAAGALFLPRGGYRDGDGIELSQNGYYWSSTQYSADHSYLLYFDNGSSNVSGDGNMKSHGRYVRLVREASNGGGGAEPFGGTNW